jgi:hypothetical protein
MAFELFGPEVGAYAGVACVVSYLFSGHAGIYTSQRIGYRKGVDAQDETSLAVEAKMADAPPPKR